uniref:Uncharacterized protein n=1 Tax=Arundo donax TaxID=35708 RepID=A0A0A9GXX9_ARUDO
MLYHGTMIHCYPETAVALAHKSFHTF